MNPLLQRAKDEVARKYGRENWKDMSYYVSENNSEVAKYNILLNRLEEAAELYAKYSREEEAEKLKSALRDCVSFIEGDIAYDDEKSGFVTGFIPQCVTDAKNLLNP